MPEREQNLRQAFAMVRNELMLEGDSRRNTLFWGCCCAVALIKFSFKCEIRCRPFGLKRTWQNQIPFLGMFGTATNFKTIKAG
jgi:hypothetical protein